MVEKYNKIGLSHDQKKELDFLRRNIVAYRIKWNKENMSENLDQSISDSQSVNIK